MKWEFTLRAYSGSIAQRFGILFVRGSDLEYMNTCTGYRGKYIPASIIDNEVDPSQPRVSIGILPRPRSNPRSLST